MSPESDLSEVNAVTSVSGWACGAIDQPHDLLAAIRQLLAIDRHGLVPRARGLDDAQDVALGDDRQPHRREGDEERPVRLLRRLPVRDGQHDLLADREHALGDREVPTREPGRPGHELLELDLGLERGLDRADRLLAAVHRLVRELVRRCDTSDQSQHHERSPHGRRVIRSAGQALTPRILGRQTAARANEARPRAW